MNRYLEFCLLIICVYRTVNVETYQVNVLHINEHNNIAATKAIVKVIENFRDIKNLVNINLNLQQVNGGQYNLTKYREDVCKRLQNFIKNNETVHVVLSTTTSELSSHFIRLMLIQSQMFSVHFVPPLIGPRTNEMMITAAKSYGKCECFPPVLRTNFHLYEFVWPIHFVGGAVELIVEHMQMTSVGILFDPPYSLSDREIQGLPRQNMAQQLNRTDFLGQVEHLRKYDINNVFVLGTLEALHFVIRKLSAQYVKRNFLWIFVTADDGDIEMCPFNATVLFVSPSRIKSLPEELYYQVATELIYNIRDRLKENSWPTDPWADCEAYSLLFSRLNTFEVLYDKLTVKGRIPLVKATDYRLFPSQNELLTQLNNFSIDSFACYHGEIIEKKRKLGEYFPHTNEMDIIDAEELQNLRVIKIYRVSTVVQIPFIIRDLTAPKGYKGFCIDLMDQIAATVGFDYEISESADFSAGTLLANGSWTGVVSDIVSRRVHIGLGSLSVMAEREQFIDFTVSFYEMVGIAMMMNIPNAPDAPLFFNQVMGTGVWLGVIIAYVITSLLLWITERTSPFGSQNIVSVGKKRIFTCKESFWFCLMCMMPQGGGRPPKSPAARVIVAAWWLFEYIVVATYTANLAAFLTLHRLDAQIESIEDLSQQTRFSYAPLPESFAMKYFERMSDIEKRFSNIWMTMTMNDSMPLTERRKNVVWEYPLSDTYIKLWDNIKKTKAPADLDEAAQRVKNTTASDYVFLGDATDIQYLILQYCGLKMVGEEFARRPYAIGVQQGSPLKDQIDEVILKLLSNRSLELLKQKWWHPVQFNSKCSQATHLDGISLTKISAFLLTILVGIALAFIVLILEYYWFKKKLVQQARQSVDIGLPVIMEVLTELNDRDSMESESEELGTIINVEVDIHRNQHSPSTQSREGENAQSPKVKRRHNRRFSFNL